MINITQIKKVNLDDLVKDGDRIYKHIKKQYVTTHKGEFLAIDPETKEVFLGKDGAEASTKAHQKYPDKVFYLIQIGADTPEQMAKALGIR